MTPPETNLPRSAASAPRSPVAPEAGPAEPTEDPATGSSPVTAPAPRVEAAPVQTAPDVTARDEAPTVAAPPDQTAPDQTAPVQTAPVQTAPVEAALRDIGDVPAVEVVTTVALHLMSASAVKLGLGEDEEQHPRRDLAEARTLITALAGLVTAAAPTLGTFHAAPLRDGLQTLQRAFREASLVPDPPGEGPGEQLTGPVR